MVKNAFWFKISPINIPTNDKDLCFAGMLGNTVFAYLDDLIIASKNPETHSKTLKAVLQKLHETGMKVKLSKCELNGKGIHISDDKITALKNFHILKV